MKKGTKKSTKKGTSKNNDNKVLLWSVLVVSLLIVLAISLTYAYFSRNVNQIGEDPDTTVVTGKLDVDFTTTEYITNTNAMLINDDDAYNEADKTVFSVTRSKDNTVKRVYYNLSLVNINISDNLKSPYLKWRLYDTDTITSDTEPLNEGDFDGLLGDTINLYDIPIAMPEGVTHNFVLLVWLSNDKEVNQTGLLDGSFSAKVKVTATNVEL